MPRKTYKLLKDRHTVQNKEGTTNEKAVAGSWKKFWLEYSGKDWPEFCSINNCGRKTVGGAHIFICRYKKLQNGTWILPMCLGCNRDNKDWMKTNWNVLAVEIDYGRDVVGDSNYTVTPTLRYVTPTSSINPQRFQKNQTAVVDIEDQNEETSSDSWWCNIL